MNEEKKQTFEKLFNPDTLRASLMKASLYMTAYEVVTNCLIDTPRSFFTINEDDSEYKIHIENRAKSRLEASLLWLKEMGCLDESDIQMMNTIRRHRNDIAHDLPRFLTEEGEDKYEVNEQLLFSMIEIMRRFDIWWVREFVMEIDYPWAEMTQEEKDAISDEDINSSGMILLSYIYRVVNDKDGQEESF